jgi:hypothetical protein
MDTLFSTPSCISLCNVAEWREGATLIDLWFTIRKKETTENKLGFTFSQL